MSTKTDDWIKKPKSRRLQVFAFDPSVSASHETAALNQLTIGVHWEKLAMGPTGEYLEIVDIDPPSNCVYPPVDLDEPFLLVQDGLSPSEGVPQFHQQMVYAVASTTIENFEKALGRPMLWSPHRTSEGVPEYVRRLRLYPHALREANAYYSPAKKAILFGYFAASTREAGTNLPGGTVFTCLSHDIIVHETSHALLDGLHPYFSEPSNPDVLALHEAFADLVALFQHFSYPEVLRSQIARTRGDLTSENLLGELAQQFGQAIGGRGALRSAIGGPDPVTGVWQRRQPDPTRLGTTLEPHARGAILVTAVFDAFLTVYTSRIADLLRIATAGTGLLPQGDIHPDLVNRLADEAARVARHILNMCIRALDYCPPVDITFGEYLRAVITADYDTVPADRDGYRLALIEAFHRHGIYPAGVRSLSEESLLWRPPSDDLIRENFFQDDSRLRDIRRFASSEKLSADERQHIYTYDLGYRQIIHDWLTEELVQEAGSEKVKAYREALCLYFSLADEENLGSVYRENSRPLLEVSSVRPAYRLGPDGLTVADLVVEINQSRAGYFDRDKQAAVDRGQSPTTDPDFVFRGGATLLISTETGEVRYVIGKRVGSNRRLEMQRLYLTGDTAQTSLRATYFGDALTNAWLGKASAVEPFALLHRGETIEEVRP